jgi:hypothetical protein
VPVRTGPLPLLLTALDELLDDELEAEEALDEALLEDELAADDELEEALLDDEEDAALLEDDEDDAPLVSISCTLSYTSPGLRYCVPLEPEMTLIAIVFVPDFSADAGMATSYSVLLPR